MLKLGAASANRIAKGILSIFSILLSHSNPKPSLNFPRRSHNPLKFITTTSSNPETIAPLVCRRDYHAMSAATVVQDLDFQSPSRHVTTQDLGSAEELARWLGARMPAALEAWGIEPGTKNVTNLWVELLEGEITLEDSCPPMRTVHVASVNIRNNAMQRVLVESHQELGDGSLRVRNRPLSEKMKAGETLEEACLRGIYEELGPVLGVAENVDLMVSSYERQVEERNSVSYPGLLTCYVVHSVDACVRGLPETDFFTEEDEDARMNGGEHGFCAGGRERAIGVKKHFWKWVPANEEQKKL